MKPDVIAWLNSKLSDQDINELLEGRKKPPVPVEPPPPVKPPEPPKPPANGDMFKVAGVHHRYATIDPWNSDKAVMVLHHQGGQVGLHDGHGEFYRLLPGVNHSSEIVWTADRKVFCFVDGNSARRFDLAKPWESGAISTICHFPEYIAHDPDGRNGVRAMGEGDLIDGRYWALAGTLPSGELEIFSFDTQTGTVGRKEKLSGVDGLYVTPRRNILVSYYNRGKNRQNGLELFDPDMKFIRQVAPIFQHMDVTTFEGQDAIVRVNENSNDIELITVVDGKSRVIWKYGWHAKEPRLSAAFHVSCPDNSDGKNSWALVTAYSPNFVDDPDPKANVIAKVPFDGMGATAFTKHQSDASDYMGQPKAAVSHDGTRYIYDRHDGESVIGLL